MWHLVGGLPPAPEQQDAHDLRCLLHLATNSHTPQRVFALQSRRCTSHCPVVPAVLRSWCWPRLRRQQPWHCAPVSRPPCRSTTSTSGECLWCGGMSPDSCQGAVRPRLHNPQTNCTSLSAVHPPGWCYCCQHTSGHVAVWPFHALAADTCHCCMTSMHPCLCHHAASVPIL
jgi:hypothetical protein